MVTAQINAVSPAVSSKAKVQSVKADGSFSDILGKESAASASKGGAKESKGNNSIVSEKYYKEDSKVEADSNQTTGKPNDKMNTDKKNDAYKAKDDSYKTTKDSSLGTAVEETKSGEGQDEKAESLMAIIASMFTQISEKTGIDETTVKDYIVNNDLTSADLLDINSWKGLVTEANGLNDISAILTNDEAFKDLGNISDIINAHLAEMGQMTSGMTEGVTDEAQIPETIVIPEEVAVKTDELLTKFVKSDNVETAAPKEDEASGKEVDETGSAEELAAFSAMADKNAVTGAHTQSGFEQGNSNSRGNNQTTAVEGVSAPAHNIFDNIAANIEKLEGTNSLPEGTTARDIFNQVTSQIKNLHAPDRTSLEFLLTPAMLGKVAVNVSSKNGILQAEFRVENAQAKAALESQIADLKLNFENQGLKVSEVSVMISENGIGSNDQGKNTGEEGKKHSGKRNRSFAIDGEDAIDYALTSPEDAIRAYTDGDTGSNINLGA